MKVAVIGCGRVGAPLLTYLKHNNIDAIGIDIDRKKHGPLSKPLFKEEKWSNILFELNSRQNSPMICPWEHIKDNIFDTIIITCGTPINTDRRPDKSQLDDVVNLLKTYKIYNNNTLFIMRSTLFPGGTKYFSNKLGTKNIVFACERIAEGYSLSELRTIPQIIGSDSYEPLEQAKHFFMPIVDDILEILPENGGTTAAEISKLVCNNWRYISFAAANEFAMLCNEYNINYNNIIKPIISYKYMRGGPPLAALNIGGPCLSKDGQIMIANSKLENAMTKGAWVTAEKTPLYFIKEKIKDFTKFNKIGILGYTFKPESDNPTNSLTNQVIAFLEEQNCTIKVFDPYAQHAKYHSSLQDVLQCQWIIIMTNHKEFTYITGENVIRL